MTSLGHLPGETVARLGDYAFVAHEGAEHGLASLVDRAARVAGALSALGVAPGDRVAVVMTNSPDVLVACFAIWRAGAVVMPVIPAVTAGELTHVLNDSGARVAFASATTVALVRAADAEVLALGEGTTHPFAVLEEAAPAVVVPRGDDDLAALLYTGGTTGRAKGVMLTSANLWTTSWARQQMVELAGTTSVLVPLPMSHVFGLINALSRLHVSRPGTLHLMTRFDGEQWVKQVEAERITASALVPSMLQLLLAQPLESADLSSLTYITSGGSPLPMSVRHEFERRVPWVRVCDGYGCTEITSTATMSPADARRDGSVGLPLPGVRLRIEGDDGTEPPTGVDGEVCVSSPGVMAGYWSDPEATGEVLVDGWLHTGDVGHVDDDGYLFVVDRSKDLIIRGGFNVYPRDVEDVLLQHPAVAAAAVVGRPDTVLGEEVVAFVSVRAPIAEAELLAFAAERLAKTKHPREVRIVDTVPLTSVGKTDRKAVRRLLGS
ncbi:MAG: AMP-dependent synthetase and ligase [Frankiales bacterium]|nr:AMP-dependent synthetase and ligase [Frankiales bacterium]